jgi:energy-coupling factor transporter ATP-binding protein EcfA2
MLQFGRVRNRREVSGLSSTLSSAAVLPAQLDRVAIIGTSGSGKSSLARTLAGRLGCAYVELDAIHWLPGWVEKDPAEFRASVGEAVAGPKWVVDGNYIRVRDLVWSRATTIIWLNYSFRIVFWRALRRTIARIVTGETILNGNRETIRKGLFSLDGVPAWVVRTYRLRKRENAALLASGDFSHAQILVFRHPKEAERFLAELPVASSNQCG